MKLHSPSFERALRRQVRQAVRRSPELKREFRRANRVSRNYSLARTVRPFYGAVLAVLVWGAVHNTGQLAAGLAVINLWLLALLCSHVSGLWARLYAGPELQAMILLPLPRERIFYWQLQQDFRQSLFALLDLLIVFGVLAHLNAFSVGQCLGALLVAVLTWGFLRVLTFFCAARFPRWPFQLVFTGLLAVCAILFLGRRWLSPAAIAALGSSAPALNLVLPTGWGVSLFQCLALKREWWLALLLLPMAAIFWTAKDSIKRLLAGFEFQESVQPEAPDLVPAAAQNFLPERISRRPAHVGITAIEEIVQTRAFLAAPTWSQHGWLEQKLWARLNPRERVLSEFVFPDGIVLLARWRGIFRNLLITVLAALVLGFVSPAFRLSCLGIGLFVTFCQALAQVINQGRAFQPTPCSGVNIPMYAGFGIGFKELSRLLFKCSFIQAPLVMAYASVAGVVGALLIGFTAGVGLMFGLKFGGLMLASRFIFVTFAFSSGTDDTSGIRLRGVMLLGFMTVIGLIFIGFGIASLCIDKLLLAAVSWAVALLAAWLFHCVYGWFYRFGRFDLMSLPRQ